MKPMCPDVLLEVDPILWTGFRHSQGGIPGS